MIYCNSRAEFEKWLKNQENNSCKREFEGYYYPVEDKAWDVWQASRAVLVVELPHCGNESHDEYRSCVEVELDKVGIKYE